MINTAAALAALSALAYEGLTVAGVMLWMRTRTLSAVLVALGFLMGLADQLFVLAQDVQVSSAFRGQPGDALLIMEHHL